MLVNLKDRLVEPRVLDLLEMAAYTDPAGEISSYRENAKLELLGLESEEELIALIGYEMREDGVLTIRHLAVLPEAQGGGYGRGIILETLEREKPKAAVAETDEEAVEFYRRIGFTIESLGEKYPGTERFLCTFETEF